eukprot:2158515-Prymnesium_polylepis.1
MEEEEEDGATARARGSVGIRASDLPCGFHGAAATWRTLFGERRVAQTAQTPNLQSGHTSLADSTSTCPAY